jgi:hypothetical protein
MLPIAFPVPAEVCNFTKHGLVRGLREPVSRCHGRGLLKTQDVLEIGREVFQKRLFSRSRIFEHGGEPGVELLLDVVIEWG